MGWFFRRSAIAAVTRPERHLALFFTFLAINPVTPVTHRSRPSVARRCARPSLGSRLRHSCIIWGIGGARR